MPTLPTRDAALELLHEHNSNPSLINQATAAAVDEVRVSISLLADLAVKARRMLM